MIDALVYKKNTVVEKQRAYQASHKPIWHRPARAGLYMGVYKVAFAASALSIVYSAFTLIKGK